MEKKEDVTDAACATCGACCIPHEDYDGQYAHVDPEEAPKIQRHGKRLVVVNQPNSRQAGPGDYNRYAMSTTHDKRGNCRCSALRGTLGRRVHCSIYPDRPRVCRTFRPGSVACLISRHELREAGQLK